MIDLAVSLCYDVYCCNISVVPITFCLLEKSIHLQLILGFNSDDLTEVTLIMLCRKISNGMKEGKHWAEMGENRLVTPERDGRLRNLLKKTYLRRWIGAQDFSGQDTQTHLNNAGDMTARRSSSMDFARLVIAF